MIDWCFETLIKTMLYLGCFFTGFGFLKYICYTVYILISKVRKKTIEKTLFVDEIFTAQSVSAFFIGFSWIGYYLLQSDFNASITYKMVLSSVVGVLCILLSAKIIYVEKSLIFAKEEILEEKIEEK